MKNKLIIAIVGIAILFGIVCSGIIIGLGIQQGETSHSQANNTKRTPIQAWESEKTKLDEFSEIAISLSYCDLFIFPADGYYLEYRMDGSCEEPEYGVNGNRFYFQEGATQLKYCTGWHLFFNSRYSSTNQGPFYVNLYVPKEQYFNLLEISSESGKIELGDIQAKNIDIHVQYGNLQSGNFSGDDISVIAESGNIELGNIDCNTLEIDNQYGNITADSCKSARKTALKLESGDLTLSKLETDSLILSNEYGNCSVDEFTVKQSDIAIESGNLKLFDATLGTTEIKNEYGDVTLNLAGKTSDYNYDLNASYGAIKLDGKTVEADEDGISRYQKDNGKESEIIIDSDSGVITIR